MDKTFLGTNAAGAGHAPALEPISRIVLIVDDDNEYRAGDDSGRTLEVSCPYGSQAMANALLSQLGGYAYQPMTATDALLDPAAELGDGVTVDGVYTVLAQTDTTFDALCAADIAAPGEEEIGSEYQYTSQSQSESERKLAEIKSTIAKTSEEITLKVEGLDRQYTALAVKVDGVTVTDDSGTTLIRGNMIQTETLYVDAAHIKGTLSAEQIQLDLTGAITWADLSDKVQEEITDAQDTAAAASKTASSAKTTVSGWTYRGTTYIDGSQIMTGTVSASTLIGGVVALATEDGETAGAISITSASSGRFAINISSSGSMRLQSATGALWLEGSGLGLGIDSDGISAGGTIYPQSSGKYDLGQSGWKWANVYATNGTIQTSDANAKTDIEALPDKYLELFDRLEPRRFRMLAGTSGRYHVGYIAQEVRAAMDECGIADVEFGGWVKDTDGDGNEIYMLRYDEFDAIRDGKIKQLEARVARLEGSRK